MRSRAANPTRIVLLRCGPRRKAPLMKNGFRPGLSAGMPLSNVDRETFDTGGAMKKKRMALCLAAWAAAALALASGAEAQTIVLPHGGHRPADGTTRVQIQAQLRAPATDDLDSQVAVQASLRKALYQIANHECEALESVFGRGCALGSIYVSANTAYRPPNAPPQDLTATLRAEFDLAPAKAP